MAFSDFKTACKLACHEREACKDGFSAMMKTKNYIQMIAVWRENWPDIVGSKFLDIIKDELREYYIEDRDEFHKAGFFFNESASRGICLVTDVEDMTITVSGDCECYVEGKATVIAEGISKLWCKKAQEANITLQGYSTGYVYAGTLSVRECATAYTNVDTECAGACKVYVSGNALLTTYGHRHIYASGNAHVNSFTYKQIDLSDQAEIIKR